MMNRENDRRMTYGNGYKYETHLHTSETSACAVSSAGDMVRAYADAGYTGIVVTDHFFNGNT